MYCNKLPILRLSAFECINCNRMICEPCLKKLRDFGLDPNRKEPYQCRNCKKANPEFRSDISQKNKEILNAIKLECGLCKLIGFPDLAFVTHESECFHECGICN